MNIHLFGSSNPTGNSFIQNCDSLQDINLYVYKHSLNSENYFDFKKPEKFNLINNKNNSVLISLSPIWLFSEFFLFLSQNKKESLKYLKTLIVVSSTSLLTKKFATNSFDKNLVSKIDYAEKIIKSTCQNLAIPCIILRPTLIYGKSGPYQDKNLSLIKQILKIFPIFVLPRRTGLRQPIHCSELSFVLFNMSIKAFENNKKEINTKEINIGGDEELTYFQMIKRYIFVSKSSTKFSCFFILLPNRLFYFLFSPLILISPKHFAIFQRISANLSGFEKVSSFLNKSPSEFPIRP